MVDDLKDECRVHVYDECDGLNSPTQRASQIISIRGCWWVVYRGVVRTEVYRKIGGLREHWGGEFGADWPWILRLAIAGEFEHVPRVLYKKHRKATSLAKTWAYTEKDYIAVLCSCLQAVADSGLPLAQALPVYWSICQLMTRLIKRVVVRTLLVYGSHIKKLLFKA